MIACVIVLALLNLLVATDPGPGESGFNAVRRSRGVHLSPPPIHPLKLKTRGYVFATFNSRIKPWTANLWRTYIVLIMISNGPRIKYE